MRVLHLLSSSELSGAERVAINICTGLRDSVEFVYASPKGSIADELKLNQISFHGLERMSTGEIAAACRQDRPDIIHAHDYRASVLAAMLRHRPPVISHLHNNAPANMRFGFKALIYAASVPGFSQIIGVSESVLNEHIARRLIKPKFIALPNVVDNSAVLKLAAENNVDECDLLFVGRLCREKNPLAFIKIVQAVKEVRPEVKAIMVGQGELVAECRALLQQLALEKTVTLTGFVANPYVYMRQAKVLVMPSRWEGFGLVALEAMLLGLPILCSPVGGLVDLVQDTVNGFWCRGTAEFATRATQLLENEDLWQVFSSASKLRAVQLSDPKAYMAKILAIYRECAGGKHG